MRTRPTSACARHVTNDLDLMRNHILKGRTPPAQRGQSGVRVAMRPDSTSTGQELQTKAENSAQAQMARDACVAIALPNVL